MACTLRLLSTLVAGAFVSCTAPAKAQFFFDPQPKVPQQEFSNPVPVEPDAEAQKPKKSKKSKQERETIAAAKKKTERVKNPVAVMDGLDKITARVTSFEAKIGEQSQFGALKVTPRVCYTRPFSDTPQTTAFVEVDEVGLTGETKRIFTGWMFAASPGINGVEHSVYDVWLKDCKGGNQGVIEEGPKTGYDDGPNAAAPTVPAGTKPTPEKPLTGKPKPAQR